MKKQYVTLLVLIATLVGHVQSQENPLVKKIGGNELERKEAEATAAAVKANPATTKNRGFGTRGISQGTQTPPPVIIPPKVEGKKRAVIFTSSGIQSASTRGIAQAISATDSVNPANPANQVVAVNQIVAPASNPYSKQGELAAQSGETAYQMTYTVDPTSELKGEIKFTKGTTEIADAGSVNFLTQLADAINNPKLNGFKFVIEGHASAEGSAEANQALSQARANAIFDFLTSGNYRVDGRRLLPVGYGESEARFSPAAGDIALSQDRRVMIYKLED